ncbi:hypothetical protein HELRODRAFT_70332, partial [Helobdella robusta]|uniref:RRM domain-containing protein n=1 Tax=Helobdella robusta TaxID=6412 RepID=T1G049_HELRO
MDITEKHLPLKTVFVQNLPFSTTTEKLRELFAKYGEMKQCFVVADKNKPENQCKGIGYVIFADEVSSKRCVKNKLKFGGRNLRVYYAKPK